MRVMRFIAWIIGHLDWGHPVLENREHSVHCSYLAIVINYVKYAGEEESMGTVNFLIFNSQGIRYVFKIYKTWNTYYNKIIYK